MLCVGVFLSASLRVPDACAGACSDSFTLKTNVCLCRSCYFERVLFDVKRSLHLSPITAVPYQVEPDRHAAVLPGENDSDVN